MKLSFDVGISEKHLVVFYFNQMWGNLYITVDGQKIMKDFQVLDFDFTKKFNFIIGVVEKHTVRIEQERYMLFGGLRKQKYRVFIDEEKVKELEGY